MSDPHCCRARTEPVEQRKGEGGGGGGRREGGSTRASTTGLWRRVKRVSRCGSTVLGGAGGKVFLREIGIWGGVGGGLDQWERGKRVQGNAAGS